MAALQEFGEDDRSSANDLRAAGADTGHLAPLFESHAGNLFDDAAHHRAA